MTEINMGPSRLKPGVTRMKKANPKIDMTPLVDLGFLLISFFIFTTEISRPAITNLYVPKDDDPTPIPESKSLTILLANKNNIFYYNGDMTKAIKNKQVFQTSYNESDGVGDVIRQKQNELLKRNLDKKELIILIKPGITSTYKNVVDALDEMLINGVTRYIVTNPEKEETSLIESSQRNR